MRTSRRAFLIQASILYKVAETRPALAAAGPNDQIGVGFIGVGIRGSEHLNTFKKMPGVRPIMAADVYDGHLAWAKENTEGAIETTRDYHALLARRDIDAVAISTPDHWHRQMVLDALAAGKHVFIEKPMTWSIREGAEIMAAVKESGKLLMVGSQAKTSSLTAKAREIVKSGILGKISMVRLADYRNAPEGAWLYPIPADASEETIDWARWLGPAPKRALDLKRFFRWRCWWEYSGGVATDMWVHQLTTMHEIMDVKGPKSAVAQGGIYRWKDGRTCPDLLAGLLEYPGFVVEITANLGSTYRATTTTISGSEATLTLDSAKSVQVTFERPVSPVAVYGVYGWTKAAREQYFASVGVTEGQRPALPPAKPPQQITIEPGLSHSEYFIQSLREGTPSKETAEEGHYAAGAAHLANMAYRRGKRMQWDLETGKVRES